MQRRSKPYGEQGAAARKLSVSSMCTCMRVARPSLERLRGTALEERRGWRRSARKVAAESLAHLTPPLARSLLGGDRAGTDHSQQRILDGVVNTQTAEAMQRGAPMSIQARLQL